MTTQCREGKKKKTRQRETCKIPAQKNHKRNNWNKGGKYTTNKHQGIKKNIRCKKTSRGVDKA